MAQLTTDDGHTFTVPSEDEGGVPWGTCILTFLCMVLSGVVCFFLLANWTPSEELSRGIPAAMISVAATLATVGGFGATSFVLIVTLRPKFLEKYRSGASGRILDSMLILVVVSFVSAIVIGVASVFSPNVIALSVSVGALSSVIAPCLVTIFSLAALQRESRNS